MVRVRRERINEAMYDINSALYADAAVIAGAAPCSAIRVKFQNVGRGKMRWETTLPDLEYRTLMKAVKARGAICSRYPEFEVDDDGTGCIIAGFRCVGTFEWQNAADQTPTK